jgi:hypothetical protein
MHAYSIIYVFAASPVAYATLINHFLTLSNVQPQAPKALLSYYHDEGEKSYDREDSFVVSKDF